MIAAVTNCATTRNVRARALVVATVLKVVTREDLMREEPVVRLG